MKRQMVTILMGTLLLIFVGSALLFAQITVTAEDAPSIPGTYFEMSSADTITIDLGQPGANQYWDFSGYQFTSKSYWRVLDPAGGPFKKHFPTANIIYEVTYDNNDTVTYNYATLTQSDLTQLGQARAVISGSDTTVTLLAVGDRVTPQLHLPATFGDPEWSSIFTMDTLYLGFSVTILDSNYNRIDAWGTMKTQFGEFQCLRVRQDHFQFAQSIFVNFPLEINVNYFWVAKDYGIIATVTGFSDVTQPNPDPNYTTAESIDIMTNFLTSVNPVARGSIPKEFKLFQNYPNPFNSGTTISYQLAEPAAVTLKVFNIAGQQVALLVRQQQQPGSYQLNWNASRLPSGVYYFQIQANQNILTRKCLLLK